MGITLALVGVTTFIEVTIVGVILTIVCVVRWIEDTRREIDELPLDLDRRLTGPHAARPEGA